MKVKFLGFLLIISFSLSAQPSKIEKLSIEEGLSNDYVVSITQDKDGFVWFATESGLNRFDGQKFRVYKKNIDTKHQSISGNELNKVYADTKDNVVWIATQREGLNRFDNETKTFKHFKHDPENPQSIITNDVTDITNAPDGNLWISTYSNGVEYFDKRTERFIHYNKATVPDMIDEAIWTVQDDDNGYLYIGHVNAGLSILSLKDKKIKHFVNNPNDPNSLPGNTIRAICIDNNKNVWVGTNNGLALFHHGTETFTVFRHVEGNAKSLVSNYVCSIIQLEDGSIFVGTENGGVSILNLQQNMFLSALNTEFTNIINGDSNLNLSDKTVRSVFQDSFGNIWIGTYGGGVNFISSIPSLFNVWVYSAIPSIKNRLNNKIAWGICADNRDNLWIGTDGGGINYFEDGIRKNIYFRESGTLSDNAILCGFRDSNNNLWFGTFRSGVYFYDYQAKKFNYNPLVDLRQRDVRCFYEDDKKNLWIGTDNGLYLYNLLTKEVKNYTTQNIPIEDNFIRAIGQDKNGNLWVGTFGRGLFVFNSDMELEVSFSTINGFYSNTINNLFRDCHNQMWVATGEGLVLFSNTENLSDFRIYTKGDGLIDNYIRAIVDDNQQDIWISTNNGISRFVSSESKFFNYDHTTGVPIGNFMSGSVTKTTDGHIYFGSQNGICYFDPINIPTKIEIAPTVVTGIVIYDTETQIESSGNEPSIPVSSDIELSYKQNTFKVSFNTLNYAQNKMTEFAYQINGLDDIWYNTQGENTVAFRNIPHGKYTLNIKSRIKNQNWSDKVTSIIITIHPPLWLTWWAKLAYVLVCITIIYFIIRFYKRKLDLESSLILEKKNHQQEQDLNNERLRFYTNITHELRTPLTLILGPLDDLLEDKSLPEKHLFKISIIRKSTTRLLNLINQILEFRKTETQNKKLCVSKGDIAILIKEIGLKYKELNINKHITLDISIETQKTVLYYDTDIITTILDNLISNAIKYTQKGYIIISLREAIINNIEYTEIEVRDTGKGIAKDSLPKIFDRYYQVKDSRQVSGTGIGLALVQNLVTIHHGAIDVDSVVGKGTAFSFRIESNNTYPQALHVSEGVEVEEQLEIPQNIKGQQPTKQIILVVEDEEEIREYIKSVLSDYYKVIVTDNGAKGLELAYNYIPDIIISDIMMPVMDGIELCRKLKKDIRTSHIPVVLLTAKDSVQDRTEGYSVGADSYIVKPFNSSLLHSRITNLQESRRKMVELINDNASNKNAVMVESINKLDNEFINKVTSIIEQNIDSDKIDIAFIAEKMNMSHSTLYRKVKALTDMTANEFIRKVRIRNAEKLLLTGRYTISEVSYMVGINSLTYFRQCFKDEFGLPPSEYIKYILSQKENT